MVSLLVRDFLRMQSRAQKWKAQSLNDLPNEESVKYDPDIIWQGSKKCLQTMCDIQRGVCMCEIMMSSKGMEGLCCDQMRFGVDQSSTRLLWDLSVLVSSEERVQTTLVVGWLNKMQDWKILCMPYEITGSETVYMVFNLCLYCTVYKLVENVLFVFIVLSWIWIVKSPLFI